jgi:excisionase family DNA binding protein
MPRLLGVRETARRLGVHENTIRNWDRSGVLTAAADSAGGYRRFRSADVERLRKVLVSGRLEQTRQTTAGLPQRELDQLLTVAGMYLAVFADTETLTPPQRQLYSDVENIVARQQLKHDGTGARRRRLVREPES